MRFDSFTRFPITIDGETAAIGSASELAVALDVLKGQRDREILTQLRPHLAEIIANPTGLMLVLKSLSPVDQLSENARADLCWRTAERVYGGTKSRLAQRFRLPDKRVWGICTAMQKLSEINN